MCVDHIGRAGPAQQLTYPLPVARCQCLYADAAQHAGQVDLLAAIAPHLSDHRRARSERRALPLQYP